VSKILCVIPARAGSKRLPRKNKLQLDDKPLISWTIELAKKAFAADEILVSTDDPEILEIALDLGLEVPWLRPKWLSGDSTSSVEVTLHALDWYECEYSNVDGVMLLQPTSPFRKLATINAAIDAFQIDSRHSIVSVTKVECHPSRMFSIIDNYLVSENLDADFNSPSQALDPIYAPNGLVYLTEVEKLRRTKSFFAGSIKPLIIEDPVENIDIDTRFDFEMAALIAAAQRLNV